MKKFIIMLAITIATIGLSSCDDSVLSSSSAKKALKKEAIFANDYATSIFKTGYYEVTEPALTALIQLKDAGMITLSTETIIEKAEKRSYDYWTGYRYYTIDVEHTFANVALTDKGEKLVVKKPTTMRKDIANDLKANDNYEEELPEYMNLSEIDDAVSIEEIEECLEAADTIASDSTEIENNSSANKAELKEKANPNATYLQALDNVNIEEQDVLLGRYSLEKVKEIRCSEEMAKNGVGECKAIISFRDKTPFGFILGAPKEGYLQTISVSFIYYQDLGWTVNKISD